MRRKRRKDVCKKCRHRMKIVDKDGMLHKKDYYDCSYCGAEYDVETGEEL